MNLEKPPIVEMFIGVQFTTKTTVDTAQIILFWADKLQETYPIIQETTFLDDEFEKLDEPVPSRLPTISFRVGHSPRIRYQFFTQSKDRLVQIQPTRLILNWVRKEQEYPRFSTIHRDFSEVLNNWTQAQEGKELFPNQWELGYINFIPQGELWNSLTDWHRVSSLFATGLEAFDPLVLDDRSFQWRFQIPNKIGRITLTITQQKNSDDKLGMLVSITARGPASSVEEVHSGLVEAHQTILNLFDRFASKEAKAYWKGNNA